MSTLSDGELREFTKGQWFHCDPEWLASMARELLAARKVVEAAGKVMTCNNHWPEFGVALDEALCAYDKVVDD